VGFGLYVANFGSYDATYGSLGAAIVLLTWLYLSAYVLLLGAEINCELERQTARDTTKGAEAPLGQRGAYAADTIASGPQAEAKPSPLSDAPAAQEQPTGGRAFAQSYAANRAAARVATSIGAGKVGVPVSLLATAGLSLLRTRQRAAVGAALLAAAGGLAWLTRDDDR
jgi:membrane protein